MLSKSMMSRIKAKRTANKKYKCDHCKAPISASTLAKHYPQSSCSQVEGSQIEKRQRLNLQRRSKNLIVKPKKRAMNAPASPTPKKRNHIVAISKLRVVKFEILSFIEQWIYWKSIQNIMDWEPIEEVYQVNDVEMTDAEPDEESAESEASLSEEEKPDSKDVSEDSEQTGDDHVEEQENAVSASEGHSEDLFNEQDHKDSTTKQENASSNEADSEKSTNEQGSEASTNLQDSEGGDDEQESHGQQEIHDKQAGKDFSDERDEHSSSSYYENRPANCKLVESVNEDQECDIQDLMDWQSMTEYESNHSDQEI